MEKELFKSGYCLEFAIALKETFPNTEIRLAGFDVFDPEEEEEYFVASHAIVAKKNNNTMFFDVNGKNTIQEILSSIMIDSKLSKNVTKKYIMESLGGNKNDCAAEESFLGTLEPEAILLAKEYIIKNKELFAELEPEKK